MGTKMVSLKHFFTIMVIQYGENASFKEKRTSWRFVF